ncbi:hypothetical protein [Heyndrickxia faecalis]|uniref:hypothetical protein n=1 Tax=Heyndrickxia faecalis TaxID=2824910 RepID=UPI0032B23103
MFGSAERQASTSLQMDSGTAGQINFSFYTAHQQVLHCFPSKMRRFAFFFTIEWLSSEKFLLHFLLNLCIKSFAKALRILAKSGFRLFQQAVF